MVLFAVHYERCALTALNSPEDIQIISRDLDLYADMAFYLAEHPVYLASGALIAIAFYAFYAVYSNTTSKLPGPWYTKWTDAISRYQWLIGRRTNYIHDLHRKYGPMVRISPHHVAVADLEAVKMIYTTKETYHKSDFYRDLTGQPIASIFSTSDVDMHRKLRRLLASAMSESSLKSLVPQISVLVELTIQRMKEELKVRGAIDVFQWSLFMATDIIGELSFGESFHMLEQGKKNQYIEDLENVASASANRVAFPGLFRLAKRHTWALPIFKATVIRVQRMLGYAKQSLERHQAHVESDPSNAKVTFFTRLFKAKEEEKIGFNDVLINAQTYIVAGSDTTANTLTYLIWSVCKRPALRDTLVKELCTLPQGFTEWHLRELPLLNQIIEETLRLYSAAPAALPRVVPAGGADIGGYQLGEGTVVSTQAYTLHRDPEIFENPHEFYPQRWENPTKAMKEAFMPFGRGPRICIGLHLAYIELRLATARFFQQFPTAHPSTREGMTESDMDEDIYFLITPKNKRCLIEG